MGCSDSTRLEGTESHVASSLCPGASGGCSDSTRLEGTESLQGEIPYDRHHTTLQRLDPLGGY